MIFFILMYKIETFQIKLEQKKLSRHHFQLDDQGDNISDVVLSFIKQRQHYDLCPVVYVCWNSEH